MDNQHQKIKGYSDLSQEEIDMMNRIKTTGAELLALQSEVRDMLNGKASQLCSDEGRPEQWQAFMVAEPLRWAAIAKTDIQTGLMALIRSVAQPTV